MHVWNPQLEQHLDNFQQNDNDEGSTTSSGVRENVTASDCDKSSFPNDNKTFPTTKRRNVRLNFALQSAMEWIGIVIVALCCFTDALPALALSTTGSVLLCILSGKLAFWQCKQSYIRKRQQHEYELQQCRIQLSSLLGSIGAPPLQQHQTNVPCTPQTVKCDVILEFTTAHVDLIQQVDCCLDKLRIAVGMSFHSSQHCVERVEQNTLHRNKSSVVLPNARRMLLQVMVQHYQSLVSLFPTNNNGDDSVEVPQVVTLAWLKHLRQETSALLSFQLSCLLSSEALAVSKTALQASIVLAKESIEYLTGVFSLGCDEESLVDSEWNQLCRQFEQASVALWACQSALLKTANHNGTGTDSDQVLEFLQHFERLLHSINNVKETLTTSEHDLSEHDKEGDEHDSNSAMARTGDTGDYEYTGTLSQGLSQEGNVEPLAESNKTIVFSGLGSVRRLLSDTDNEKDMSQPTRQYVATQGVVLHELQLRLAQMDLVEEVDANGNAMVKQVVEHEETEIARKRLSSEMSSVFLGASGYMLSELRNMIGNENGLSSHVHDFDVGDPADIS